MSVSFYELPNYEKHPFYQVYDTKEDFYNSLKNDAEEYAKDFWKNSDNWKAIDLAFTSGIDSMMDTVRWITYWEKALEEICNLMIPMAEGKIITIDDEVKKIWADLEFKVARETFKKLLASEIE